ncbi:MAG: hydrogenase maturation protease [Sedimentisphaerales bacterium]|nr:hydrogenase maturation protease [Sedimentisphaerales bacterium]
MPIDDCGFGTGGSICNLQSAIRNPPPTVILGVGNILKGDDGVGPLVCARIAGRVGATVIDAGTVPENYVRPIIQAAPENLLIIDAVDFRGSPGQVQVFPPDRASDFAFSTHSLSLHLFLTLLLQERAMHAVLLGIQPGHTQLGRPISPAVQASMEALANALVATFPLSEVCDPASP